MPASPDAATNAAIVHDQPVASKPGETHWGSDPVAAMLRELDIPYIALVPGSSYRGLHAIMERAKCARHRRILERFKKYRGRPEDSDTISHK